MMKDIEGFCKDLERKYRYNVRTAVEFHEGKCDKEYCDYNCFYFTDGFMRSKLDFLKEVGAIVTHIHVFDASYVITIPDYHFPTKNIKIEIWKDRYTKEKQQEIADRILTIIKSYIAITRAGNKINDDSDGTRIPTPCFLEPGEDLYDILEEMTTKDSEKVK